MGVPRMIELNKESFEQNLKENENLVVDFWAQWCQPCHVIAPILEEISKERDDIKIMKLNVDENKEIAMQYNVKAIPTLIFFKNGKPIMETKGVVTKKTINDFIDKNKDGKQNIPQINNIFGNNPK